MSLGLPPNVRCDPTERLALLRLEFLAVEFRAPDVDIGVFQQALPFLRVQLAHDSPRRADDEDAVGIGLSFGDERARTDDAAAADDGVVQDHCADADERTVADAAAVQHRLVATETFFPSVSGMPGSACRTAASWMLVRSPMVMMSLSPRTTALNQTLAWLCRTTVPITAAMCAMNHSSPWNTTLRSPSE